MNERERVCTLPLDRDARLIETRLPLVLGEPTIASSSSSSSPPVGCFNLLSRFSHFYL